MKEEKVTIPQQVAGCGCLLVMLISGIAWFIAPELGGAVSLAGVILLLMVSSFVGAIIAENEDVRRGSGCFSVLTLIGLWFLMNHYWPAKMWIFYTFCGVYICAIIIGINYRQKRLERGKQAAQNFKKQLENKGIDLNNLDE